MKRIFLVAKLFTLLSLYINAATIPVTNMNDNGTGIVPQGIADGAPGDLDPTFGIGGQIYPPSGSQTPYTAATDIVVQPDQKIVVSASHFNSLMLSRYLPNGSHDPTFGVSGQVFQASDGGEKKLALQPDGKILVFSGVQGANILRYNPDGSLDASFDGDGVLQFSAFSAYKLAVQNDGKIIVAGTKYPFGPTHGNPSLFGLARLNSDGSFDNTFGSDGIVTTAFPYTSSSVGGIVIQGDGKIVAAGSSLNIDGNGFCSACNIALSRYNADGSLDTSFGTSGRVVTPGGSYNSLSGSDVTLQADHKIVVAGHYGGGGLVIRYMPDGLLDASFGSAGQVSIPALCPFSIAIQSNGKIVVAGGTTGYDPSNSSHELGRLLSNGAADPSFGNNGRVTTLFPNLSQGGYYINGRSYGMAIQGDGKIVTAGNWAGTDWDGNAYWSYVAIARYIGDSFEARRAIFDFDGDGKSDIGVFRPNGAGDAQWWIDRSTAGLFATTFGSATDKIAAADFTGDGKADVAFWRPSTGYWYVLRSEDLSYYAFPFGTTGDVPIPADYDGDGKADPAVFRPSTSTWYIQLTTGGTRIEQFGTSTDNPVAADYDGDGKADIAIVRPTGGSGEAEWWIDRSTAGVLATAFGNSTDQAVPGDYTGDGKTDIAFWRPSTGEWFVLRSENNSYFAFPFGQTGDIPSTADYDGDGKTDAAVYRNGTWWMLKSTGGVTVQQFGMANDKPIPAAYTQ